MEATKTRCANFTSHEEDILISLTKKYISIIECKRCDASYNRAKARCWLKIRDEYNNMSGQVYRTTDALRKKYDNIKTRAKRKWLEEKSGPKCGKPISFTKRELEVIKLLGPRFKGVELRVSNDVDVQRLLDGDKDFEEQEEDNDNSESCGENRNQHDYIVRTPHKKNRNLKRMESQDTFMNIEYIEESNSPQDMPPTGSMKVERDDDVTLNTGWCNTSQSSPRIFRTNKSGGEQDHEFLYEETQLKLRNMREEHELKLELLRQKTAAEIRIMERICEKEIQLMEAKANKEIELMELQHKMNVKPAKK